MFENFLFLSISIFIAKSIPIFKISIPAALFEIIGAEALGFIS